MRTNVPRAIRALRQRRGWRQVDLGCRAGISRDVAQRAEAGKLHGITIRSLDGLATALDADLVIELRWRGADLDALIDRTHAALVTATAERLQRAGWIVYPEVSFNHFGDRGRCDLVAWHGRSRTLLVVEVKSRIGDLQELLGRLDVKVRLGTVIAEQVGLGRPTNVAGAIVLREDGASRRHLRNHAALFRSYTIRGRTTFAWLRAPRAGGRLLWFESTDADGSNTKRSGTARHRRPAG